MHHLFAQVKYQDISVLIFILVKEIVLYTGKSPLEAPYIRLDTEDIQFIF